jgi:hypothetical protein
MFEKGLAVSGPLERTGSCLVLLDVDEEVGEGIPPLPPRKEAHLQILYPVSHLSSVTSRQVNMRRWWQYST